MGKKIDRNKIFCLKKRYILYSISDISALLDTKLKKRSYQSIGWSGVPTDMFLTNTRDYSGSLEALLILWSTKLEYTGWYVSMCYAPWLKRIYLMASNGSASKEIASWSVDLN